MAESISLRSRLARINWITGAPFTLSVTLMEVLWVYPWLAWFSQLPSFRWSKTPLSLISFILILGTSFVLSKQLINREWSLGKVRLTIIGTGIIIILVILRFEFSAGTGLFNWEWFGYMGRLLLDSFSHFEPLILAMVLSALLWWRGIRLGRSPLEADDIYRNFAIGVASLIVLILIAGASSWTNYQFDMSSIWLFLAGFFFFGLLANLFLYLF